MQNPKSFIPTEMIMKARFVLLAALLSIPAFAQPLTFELVETQRPGQPWPCANELVFKVKTPGSLWISTPVNSWTKKSVNKEISDVLTIGQGTFGYVDDEGECVSPEKFITKKLSFSNPNGSGTVTPTACFVGNFKEGDRVVLWLTSSNNIDIGLSNGPIRDDDTLNDLTARFHDGNDLAGNPKFNFGFKMDPAGADFIVVGGEAVAE